MPLPANDNWKCKFCQRTFSTQLFYTNHMKTHLENVCFYCNHGFPTETHLMAHIKTLHEGEALKFVCNFCPKKFKTKKVLLNHKRLIHETKHSVFFCGLCRLENEKCFTKDGIRQHLREHASERIDDGPSPGIEFELGSKIGKVELCSDPTTGEVRIVKNVYAKKQLLPSRPRNYDNMPIFHCPKCTNPVQFKKTADLFLHLAEVHDEFVLVCDCGEKFNRKIQLVAHRKHHAKEFIDIVGADYGAGDDVKSDQICLLCDKNFGKNVSGLKYHVQCTHDLEQNNTFVCPYACPKTFKANTNLISHIRHVHAIRQINCGHCDRKFTNQSELVRHMRRQKGLSVGKS